MFNKNLLNVKIKLKPFIIDVLELIIIRKFVCYLY